MLSAIYRVNRWYDDLEGALRFLLFLIPMLVANILISFGGPVLVWLGIAILGAMTTVRVIPIFWPERRS